MAMEAGGKHCSWAVVRLANSGMCWWCEASANVDNAGLKRTAWTKALSQLRCHVLLQGGIAAGVGRLAVVSRVPRAVCAVCGCLGGQGDHCS